MVSSRVMCEWARRWGEEVVKVRMYSEGGVENWLLSKHAIVNK